MPPMNDGDVALKLALELMHMPSRVRYVRAAPLPDGLDDLLCIAAGDETKARHVASVLERDSDLIAAAARFFVEQILLAPDANCYRMLGAEQTASAASLRRNMALILRVLHPDVERDGLSVLAGRVIGAWDQLKTPEKRRAYDQQLALRGGAHADHRRRMPGRIRKRQTAKTGWLQRLAAAFGRNR